MFVFPYEIDIFEFKYKSMGIFDVFNKKKGGDKKVAREVVDDNIRESGSCRAADKSQNGDGGMEGKIEENGTDSNKYKGDSSIPLPKMR